MSDDRPAWEMAEERLNSSSAKDAERSEKQLDQFRKVLRPDLSDEDIAFYDAAIDSWTVTQIVERMRIDAADRVRATGHGNPSVTGPRQEALRPARQILESARSFCVRDGELSSNIEMYEWLIAMGEFRHVTDASRLRVIDAARAAGAMWQ